MVRRSLVFALLVICASGVALAGKGGGGTTAYDTPATLNYHPFNVDPFYKLGGDGRLNVDGTYTAYTNGVDGVRSVFNSGDYILNLNYSRSASPRSQWINMGNPAVNGSGYDVNGLKPPVMGIWQTMGGMKIGGMLNIPVTDVAQPMIVWVDVYSADGKRLYRLLFNGNYGSTKANVTHATSTEWIVEAPAGSIARVMDVTTRSTPIGNYYVDFKMRVTLP